MARWILVLVLVGVGVGCASSERYFRLEELGEDWRLEVEEIDGSRFRAVWVPGDNRSTRIVNIQDAPRPGFTAVNTLYLEVDEQGKVVDGWLKRFIVRDVRRASVEDGATWWRVIEGWCRLDEQGNGKLKVRTQGGYNFEGKVIPMEDMETRKSRRRTDQ
jgi:hypothetical protein